MPLAQEAPLPDFAVEVNTVDRRREGRLEIDNPHLIDMLRRPEFMSIEEALAENGQVIDVGPATRLDRAAFPFIILMTACFWAVIAGVLWRTL